MLRDRLVTTRWQEDKNNAEKKPDVDPSKASAAWRTKRTALVWKIDLYGSVDRFWMFEWDLLSGTARRESLPNRGGLKLKLSSFSSFRVCLSQAQSSQLWKVCKSRLKQGDPGAPSLGKAGDCGNSWLPPDLFANRLGRCGMMWPWVAQIASKFPAQDTTAPQQRQQERGECTSQLVDEHHRIHRTYIGHTRFVQAKSVTP